MAVAMFLSWDGFTPEQYDARRKIVDWEGKFPEGALFHVAGFDDHGIYVTDIWETAEQFQAFVDQRLMPGVAEVGVTAQPVTTVVPMHALFTPGFKRL